MSVDIDFANLSIKDALDLAILVEEEAEERYRELADNLEFHNTKDAARFFRFMMTCEAKHGEELSAKRQELFGDQPVGVDRSMLWDVEAPGFETAKSFMTLQEALDVALEAETKAFEFFDGALPEVAVPAHCSLAVNGGDGGTVSRCPLWVKSRHLSMCHRCPLYPRKRTFSEAASMSAKCQKRTFA